MNRATKPFIACALSLPFSPSDCEKLLMHYSPTPSTAANNFDYALVRMLEVLADGIQRFLHISVVPGVSGYVLIVRADEEQLAALDNYFGSAEALLQHMAELLGIMASHLETPWRMVLSIPDAKKFAGAEES